MVWKLRVENDFTLRGRTPAQLANICPADNLNATGLSAVTPDIADDLGVIVADLQAARGPDDSGHLVVRHADWRCPRGAGGAH